VSAPSAAPAAVFAGLCTLDIIQAVDRVPGPDEKVTALDQVVAAGGPATNAAVTFAHLGGDATLLTGAGRHPLAEGIRADLAGAGVRLIDAAANDDRPPPVSAIAVTAGTGDRSVVSRNAAGRELASPRNLDALADRAQAVLIDGHHPRLALDTAIAARERGVPCILDGGSWKANTPGLLPYVDVAVCSADFGPSGLGPLSFGPPGFDPPGAPGSVLEFLLGLGVRWAAVTDGPRPVTWAGADGRSGSSTVPAVTVADTLGAGDVFHGAFTYAVTVNGMLDEDSFVAALGFATEVAGRSCQSFGTRAWMG
jgi:sugar/nucleoside kinase (ribokinase family)